MWTDMRHVKQRRTTWWFQPPSMELVDFPPEMLLSIMFKCSIQHVWMLLFTCRDMFRLFPLPELWWQKKSAPLWKLVTMHDPACTAPSSWRSFLLERMRLFDGMSMCCTGIEHDCLRMLIKRAVKLCGGEFTPTYTRLNTDIVLAARVGMTDKWFVANAHKKPIVFWLTFLGRAILTNKIPLASECKLPVLFKLVITPTGGSPEALLALEQVVVKHGGTFSLSLEEHHTTHLIYLGPGESEKRAQARAWNIHIVSARWLADTILAQSAQRPARYALLPPVPAPP